MYKLKFLLAVYARDFWKVLAAIVAAGGAITLAASFTAAAGVVALVYAIVVGALAAIAATTAITVLNAAIAAGMHRGIERFEAAYDGYRRANHIPDIFYEEMDLAESLSNAPVSRLEGV